MAMRDEDFGSALTLTETDGGLWSPPMAAPVSKSPDRPSLYEQALARAEAAEARAEELRSAELAARSEAGAWKSRFKACRQRLSEAEQEAKDLRRAARDVPSLLAEVARLERLVSEARAGSSQFRMIEALHDEIARLQKALASKVRKGATGPLSRENARLHKALERLQGQKDELAALRAEVSALRKSERTAQTARSRESVRLGKALEQSQAQKDTIKALRAGLRESRKDAARLSKQIARLDAEIAELGEEAATAETLIETLKTLRAENAVLQKTARASESQCKWLNTENDNLHRSIWKSLEHRKRLEARHRDELDRLNRTIAWERSYRMRSWEDRQQAVVRPLSRRLARLRKTAERAKDTIEALRQRNARLRTEAQGLRADVRELRAERAALASRVETLEGQLDKLRSSRAVLSKAAFGSKSERQKKPGTGRKRGQQRGAPGHGRTPRPKLQEKTESRDPPKDARICSCCGKPYVANGERVTTLIEIAVKAHIRKIERTRWRRGCDCASSPLEVTAPPAPRLFPGTLYGTSFWARFLFEHCACRRPLSRVAAWYADQGLPVSPGTLANSLKRFAPLFGPIHEAILAHQNRAAVRHADETGWRVQEFRDRGRSSRAWLWTSVSPDAVYFHIDPSRSAEVAMKLFGSTEGTVVLVCDRLSTYKKLARELGGKVILQWCWAHQRRSFIECAAGHVRLRRWCRRWIKRIAKIYRLNDARLKHYDPALPLERQTPAFDAAQARLKKAVDKMFADAEAELAGMTDKALRFKPLRSLLKHREGLCVFVDKPFVPMDNNAGERALRGPVIGRRLTFGSNSEDGAKFTAILQSVVGTLSMNGIDVLRWLEAWLEACAKNGCKPPDDLSPWLPWTMSEARRRKFSVQE